MLFETRLYDRRSFGFAPIIFADVKFERSQQQVKWSAQQQVNSLT